MPTPKKIALAFWCSLCFCSAGFSETVYHSPDSFVGKMILEMDEKAQLLQMQEEKEKYRQVAHEFIAAAMEGSPEKMLRLTSQLTIKNSGSAKAKKIYETQVIPAFRGKKITWKKGGEITTDDTGNQGVIFSGNATGNPGFPFYLTVMKEHGKFRVITITTWR